MNRSVKSHPFILVEVDECSSDSEGGCYRLDPGEASIKRVDACRKPLKCFTEFPFEEAYRYIYDPGKGCSAREFIVMDSSSGKGIYIGRGTRLELDELEGYKVILDVEIGSSLGYGDKIGYVLTGKGEVRNIRSRSSGVVVYAAHMPIDKPQKAILLIASDKDVREIKAG